MSAPDDKLLGSAAELFRENRYLHIERLIPLALAGFLSDYLHLLINSGLTKGGDPQVPDAPAVNGAPGFETLLSRLTPVMSKIIGEPLVPTYSYARHYTEGDRLPAHTDQAHCEVSVSIVLGAESKEPWPLFIEDGGPKPIEVHMAPGDGFVFEGQGRRHWRNELETGWQSQALVHWVRESNADAAQLAYAGRPGLVASYQSTDGTNSP